MSGSKQEEMGSMDDFFYGLCKRVDSPKSLGLYLRYRHAPKELATATIEPGTYCDAASFANDYLCVSLLGKYRGLRTGIDTAKVALEGFATDEIECAKTNARLRQYDTSDGVPSVTRSIIERMKQIVQTVWGRPSFDTLERHMGWGPGATSSLKGLDARTEMKMRFPVEVTPTAAPMFLEVLFRDRLWLSKAVGGEIVGPLSLIPRGTDVRDMLVKFTSASRMLTVPKNAKTDRTICAEPTGNIFLQKGVGVYLKHRLQHHGVDLFDQTRNQELAAHAQRLGLATIDLKSASNSVSRAVVKLLCPPDMWLLLERLRTPAYVHNGSDPVRFEMFSSMGNGFTFELESLIFYAAAKAVEEQNRTTKPIAVYGDDIIVAQENATLLIEVLAYLGFRTNVEKSFTSGRFFESCGKHYFDGIDVTPVYQKEDVCSRVEHMAFLNRIFLILERVPTLEQILRPVWRTHLEKYGNDIRGWSWMRGDGYYFIEDDHDAGLKFRPGRGYQLKYYRQATRRLIGDWGLYAYRSRKGADSGPRTSVMMPWLRAVFTDLDMSSFPLSVVEELTQLDSAYFDKHESVPCKGFDSVRNRESRWHKSKRWVPVLFREQR